MLTVSPRVRQLSLSLTKSRLNLTPEAYANLLNNARPESRKRINYLMLKLTVLDINTRQWDNETKVKLIGLAVKTYGVT